MIVNKFSTSVLRAFCPRYTYISKKVLDQIERSHGKTFFQRALMYSKQARHIGKQGLIGIKKDIDEYYRLYTLQKLQNKTLTKEDEQKKRKIREELSKFKYIICINILPMSPPLLIFFILTYPSKVPSYFCLDELHQSHQLQSIQRQKKAIQSFKLNPLNPQNFSLSSLSLEQLKEISLLLFGDYEDGVVGINKYFKDKPRRHFIHPHISRRIVIGKIRKEFKKSLQLHKELNNYSLEQFVLWKYERVMKGEDLLIYQPIQQNTQQPKTIAQDKPKKEEDKGQNK